MNERALLDNGLRYFLEVARQGSINRASQKLHVATSAVSRQIARLEAELNTQLFERHVTGMRLSPAGELLAAHALKAKLEAARVVDEITGLEGIQRGKVHIASIEGLASYMLPHVISEFRKKYSGILFELMICSSAEVTRRVSEGVADIGLGVSPPPQKNIQVEARIMAPIYAIMRVDHPLASRAQVTLSQLGHYPLALPTEDTTVRQLFDVSCSRQRLLIDPVMLCNSVNSLIQFAACGGGVTLFGEFSIRHLNDKESLIALPIKDREMSARTFEVQTMAGRTLPKGVAKFLETLCQTLSEGGR